MIRIGPNQLVNNIHPLNWQGIEHHTNNGQNYNQRAKYSLKLHDRDKQHTNEDS